MKRRPPPQPSTASRERGWDAQVIRAADRSPAKQFDAGESSELAVERHRPLTLSRPAHLVNDCVDKIDAGMVQRRTHGVCLADDDLPRIEQRFDDRNNVRPFQIIAAFEHPNDLAKNDRRNETWIAGRQRLFDKSRRGFGLLAVVLREIAHEHICIERYHF